MRSIHLSALKIVLAGYPRYELEVVIAKIERHRGGIRRMLSGDKHTASIAFLTRSLLMRPFFARLETSAAFVLPPENHAMSERLVYGRDLVVACSER